MSSPKPVTKPVVTERPSPPPTASPPPIALTSADGKDLYLRAVDAQSVIAGPLAFTQLKLVFDNPEDRVIEGRFRIALPSGASVSRFAMKIEGRWQEGEMLEKVAARRIYEDFLHRRVDPALLEQGAGNAFSARVFPIPAKGQKELIVSYAQPLDGPGDTLVPLAGLGEVAELHLEAATDGPLPKRTVLQKTAFTPDGDFVLDPTLASSDGLRSDELVVARVAALAGAAQDPLRGAVFLLDTSASRALELEAQIEAVRFLLRKLGDDKVLVLGFDQTVTTLYDGRAGRFADADAQAIRTRRAMGASNLQHALASAGRAAQRRGLKRLVLLGDGVVTAGGENAELTRTSRHLARQGVERLDVIAFGGIRDDEGLRALVTAGLARDGALLDSERGLGDAWRRLNLATRSGVKVEVEGASWWWPRTLDGVQPGDEVLVHAEVPATSPVRIHIGEHEITGLHFASAARPLVERSWARAKIASLTDRERDKGSTSETRRLIVELSTKHRVMSPYTSLVVLETQNDYERYDLKRDALADILEVKGGRLAVVRRDPLGQTIDEEPATPRRDEAIEEGQLASRADMWGTAAGESFGAGGLGLSGIGEGGGGDARLPAPAPTPAPTQGQGFGSGHGRLARSHRAQPPRVRMGSTSVSGRVPPEIIQRVVRANFGRFRACYQETLRTRPSAAGRIVAKFIIARTGKVSTVTIESEIASEPFKACLQRAFLLLGFPAPNNGVVTVSYPLVFGAEGSPTPPPARLHPTRPRSLPSPPNAPISDAPAEARPYAGRLLSVMQHLEAGRIDAAFSIARSWQARQPGEVLAWVALGEAYEAKGQPDHAARAYGSIIDLFPSRADLRRYAGERLDRVSSVIAKRLAVDTYDKAKAQRPDHPTSHRLLGYALLRRGQYEQAFAAIAKGLDVCTGRYDHAREVLRRDLGLVAASWLRASPKDQLIVEARLMREGAGLATEPSLQFVLNWETDTNDVDMHVYDSQGAHAFYSHERLASGGRLLGDVTTGFGPEMFVIDGTRRASGYRLQAHYYARGPMGYGMGKLQVIEHDGKGKLTIDDRPFVVMVDKAFVDLGTVGKM